MFRLILVSKNSRQKKKIFVLYKSTMKGLAYIELSFVAEISLSMLNCLKYEKIQSQLLITALL